MTPTRIFFLVAAVVADCAACKLSRDSTLVNEIAAPATAAFSKNFRRSNSVAMRCSSGHEE
jgi:hypothetical protein